MGIGTVPARFPGTDEEARANRATHHFDPYENRCVSCDCRPGVVADWPCGAEVPREQVVYGEDEVVSPPAWFLAAQIVGEVRE